MTGTTRAVVSREIRRPQGGGVQPILSPADVEEIVERYLVKRHRVPELAAAFYVHETTIARYLRGAGVTMRPRREGVGGRPVMLDDALWCCELVAEGYSAFDAARITGHHVKTVRRWLNRYARPDCEWRHRRQHLEAEACEQQRQQREAAA